MAHDIPFDTRRVFIGGLVAAIVLVLILSLVRWAA